MTYSDFKDSDISRLFGIQADTARLFDRVVPLEPKPWLLESLDRGKVVGRLNEKARSEVMVTPILLQCRDFLDERFAIYSGMTLDVDGERGLKGECDFILSRTHPVPMLQAPLVMIVEAKRGDIEAALAQCTAQMIAAQLFNSLRGTVARFIHGCVTSGEEWQFLRLEEKTLWIEQDRLHLQQLSKIIGILVAIIKGDEAC